ncbi:unnamed protein product [Trichogramma brassicae]|uniref:Secreted protein n=1 Tax=Trichogramma brassicae TaxID=86971 RepID=A0A6H5IFV5_9HYME|nr:unnamed protein product [Trichogramma brassicae]
MFFTTITMFLTFRWFSIASGIVGDSSINCCNLFEIGGKLVRAMIDKDFSQMKFQRKNVMSTFALKHY